MEQKDVKQLEERFFRLASSFLAGSRLGRDANWCMEQTTNWLKDYHNGAVKKLTRLYPDLDFGIGAARGGPPKTADQGRAPRKAFPRLPAGRKPRMEEITQKAS